MTMRRGAPQREKELRSARKTHTADKVATKYLPRRVFTIQGRAPFCPSDSLAHFFHFPRTLFLSPVSKSFTCNTLTHFLLDTIQNA
jgi:hypothetical protein